MAFQAIPVGSSSEEWRYLLQDTLGKEDGAAVAASLGCREVVVNVAISKKDKKASGQGSKKLTNVGTKKSCVLSEVYVLHLLMHTTYKGRYRLSTCSSMSELKCPLNSSQIWVPAHTHTHKSS